MTITKQYQLGLFAITDIHAELMAFDYARDQEKTTGGLARIATVLNTAKQHCDLSLIFDNGDTIQGPGLGDYLAAQTVQPHPIMAGLEHVGVDAVTVGNHDFNYGLDYLLSVYQHNSFATVLANVTDMAGETLFTPFVILERCIDQKPIRIAVIGLTPPQIMQWDFATLQGKVNIRPARETLAHYLPIMRAQADLIVVLLHGGLSHDAYHAEQESPGRALAQMGGFDALILGHSHQFFPNTTGVYHGLDGVDERQGKVYGIPAVMAGFAGCAVGQITLTLNYDATQHSPWRVLGSQSHILSTEAVQIDEQVSQQLKPVHDALRSMSLTPVGETRLSLQTYFAPMLPCAACDIVNQAQLDFVQQQRLHGVLGEYASLPLFAAHAIPKFGFGGVQDYVDIHSGMLSLRDVSALYPYPNHLQVVKIEGRRLKQWLERAVNFYNVLNSHQHLPQTLVHAGSKGYDCDMIMAEVDDFEYIIDLTAPLNAQIQDVLYKGEPLADHQPVLVVTNNYRAGGGGLFAGLNGEQVIYDSATPTRDILAQWISQHSPIKLIRRSAGRLIWPAHCTIIIRAPRDLAGDRGHFSVHEHQVIDARWSWYRLELLDEGE